MIDAIGTDIPLIDFEPFLTEDALGKLSVAADIYRACHEVGFLYLTHHGLSQTAIANAFVQSHQFFALPLATKQATAWVSEFSNRGYVGVERERLDETQPGDLKEAFNVGKAVSAEAIAAPQAPYLENRWPAGHGEFQTSITTLFDACAEFANKVFQAFAIALSMPEDAIAKQHVTRDYTLRLLRYPSVVATPKTGQMRAGAHSDYGSLTLLFQDQVEGLEVLNARDEWMIAPVIPNAILINTGDLMARWSNDVFRSTKHRVRLPQEGDVGGDRYSIAFFCQPDHDADIICLPTCQNANNPPKYPPVKSGEYLFSRLQATY